jgi:hypothetical protein
VPKPCIIEGCELPRWSRETKCCKKHHSKPSPIKKVTDKRKKENTEYLKLNLAYLNEHKVCQVCTIKGSTEIHHVAGRRGKHLTDVSNFLAVCRECHNRIELNREWAYEKGYLKLRSVNN